MERKRYIKTQKDFSFSILSRYNPEFEAVFVAKMSPTLLLSFLKIFTTYSCNIFGMNYFALMYISHLKLFRMT